ncbi:glycosyltransferase [Archangium sp.]|uniref:glycosyltransferase n=1 Tax=Archangium sp. TaxID=1872627 RepID=UPI002D69AE82|nr:glycosyltransferase [Archangium sp.]HYO58514.1 glycosyltransferase [Archangium sp.]
MRLCLVSRELAPFQEGEPGAYVSLACHAFARAGHEVHVLTTAHPGLERAEALYPGVRVHVARCDSGPGQRACRNEPMRHALAVQHTLQALHARHPFDFIEFAGPWGEGAFALRARRTLGAFGSAILAVRLHTPTLELHEANRVAALDLDAAYTEYQETVALREAELVLSPTHALLERVTRRLGLRQPGAVIPHPFLAEVSGERHAAPRRERTGRARILHVGPLEYRKGLHLLIEAGQRLLEKQFDVEFRFIGGDTRTGPFGQSMRAWLERRVLAAWRDRFHFEPERPRAELLPALREAAVCCFPSLWENIPGECLEAMAEGALVVGSDAGGLEELIEDGRSGLLFPSGDVARLAETLERALKDEALQRAVRKAAPERIATRCAPERYVAETERIIERLARESRPPERRPPPAKAAGKSPDVSILVPYYNMGRYLPETLRSLREQTFQDHEIILIDDGSTEPASRRLLDELEGVDKLRILRKQNGGLSSARNAGLRHARGRWVLPVDPDDLLSPTFIEKAVDVMNRHPRLGYVTSLVSFFTEDPRQPIGGWVPWGLEHDALCVENVASTCTALMERKLLEEVGGYDEWLTSFEDWDVFCSLAERGYEGMVIPEFLFHYRMRPDSMTRTVATQSRHTLIAYLLQKHPGLPTAGNRALRVQLGEMQRLRERLEQALSADKPLRYRLADYVNDTFKQRVGFIHHALRRTTELASAAQRFSARRGRKSRP